MHHVPKCSFPCPTFFVSKIRIFLRPLSIAVHIHMLRPSFLSQKTTTNLGFQKLLLCLVNELLGNPSQTGLSTEQKLPKFQYKDLSVLIEESLQVDLYRLWIGFLYVWCAIFKKKKGLFLAGIAQVVPSFLFISFQ